MANKVIVQPGGKTFTTIQAAINSITDASEKKQYTVLCSPGTYNERIVLQPWIFVEGEDEDTDNTIITYNAKADDNSTVFGVSNSGVIACTIISVATSSYSQPIAVQCMGENFHLTGCKVYTRTAPGAKSGQINTIIVSGNSKATISSCEIHQECTSSPHGPSMETVTCFHGATLELYNSNVTCVNSPNNYAAAVLADGGTVVATICNITCTQLALDLGDEGGSLKAVNCKITGKVAPGVVVVNE